MHKMNSDTSESESWISFLQCPKQRFQSRERFIRACIQCTCYDSFTQLSMIGKCLEEFRIAHELLLLIRKDRASTEEKFSAQETDTLCTILSGCTSTFYIPHIGENFY